MKYVIMTTQSEYRTLIENLERLGYDCNTSREWSFFILDEDEGKVIKADYLDSSRFAMMEKAKIVYAKEVINGEVEIKSRKPLFWKDDHYVWFSVDNKNVEKVDTELYHYGNGTWSIGLMESCTKAKTGGHGDCTQAEAEERLNADFDGEKFIARKIKITLNGVDTEISRESAQNLKKALENL